MRLNKHFSLILFIILILVSTVVYAETPEVLELKSEIKYGPFSTGYLEPQISEEEISLYFIASSETAYNYDELKEAIYCHMKNYEGAFTINYKGNTSTLENDIFSIWNEIFEEDPYLFGTVSTYGEYTANGYVNDIVINFSSFSYHTNKTQEEFVDREVERVVNEIIDGGMTDFQKVKAINDWIVNNTRYSDDTRTSEHAAYTLLNEGKGVCQAYALTAYRLLEEARINVVYVTGFAGIEHAWNLVKVDGEWYHLDTTWNDPVSKTGEAILSYKYFLISEDAIEVDHRMDDRINYPRASDTYYEAMRDINNPYEYNNHMYYTKYINSSDYKLYGLDLATMEDTKLTDNNALYVVGYDDWIYYSNYSRGGFLSKINVDGTGYTELNNVYSTDLYIEFPYLHFYDNSSDDWDYIRIGEIHEVTGITLNRTEDIVLTIGGQPLELEATIEPENATDKGITWVSSDDKVATVSDGIVTAIKAGTTTITAKTKDGDFEASVDVTVKDGYEIFALNEKETNPKHLWTIELNKEVDEETADFSSVYIENKYGDKEKAENYEITTDGRFITITNLGSYEKDKLYYVVVEKTLKSIEEAEVLIEAVKMPFVISR